MNKHQYLFVLFIFLASVLNGQNSVIEGEVFSEDSDAIEGLHIFNKTQKLSTTTNVNGKFSIEVAVNDQLLISSIQYKNETLSITEAHIKNKRIVFYLEIEVNELAEVKIGNTLSGNLYEDIANSKAQRPIDFYDVGIPGYQGKPKTKSERRLQEAGEFKPIMLLGLLGGSLPINPILNGISGRTKELKNRVALEANTEALQQLISKLGAAFFETYPLEMACRMDFFYFCAEDENFISSTRKSDLETLNFAINKYKEYQKNLEIKE